MGIAARLDEMGKPAWIALLVLTFIIAWPIGLALLAYLIWSGRMGCGGHGRWHGRHERWRENWRRGHWSGWNGSSGNTAFDEYRAETLKRLEEEEKEFREFLDRLRKAKDKEEFDQFMADRKNRPQGPTSGPTPDGQPA